MTARNHAGCKGRYRTLSKKRSGPESPATSDDWSTTESESMTFEEYWEKEGREKHRERQEHVHQEAHRTARRQEQGQSLPIQGQDQDRIDAERQNALRFLRMHQRTWLDYLPEKENRSFSVVPSSQTPSPSRHRAERSLLPSTPLQTRSSPRQHRTPPSPQLGHPSKRMRRSATPPAMRRHRERMGTTSADDPRAETEVSQGVKKLVEQTVKEAVAEEVEHLRAGQDRILAAVHSMDQSLRRISR